MRDPLDAALDRYVDYPPGFLYRHLDPGFGEKADRTGKEESVESADDDAGGVSGETLERPQNAGR